MGCCRLVCAIIIGVLGVVIIVLGGIWQGIQAGIIKNIVNKELTLNKDNMVYPKWKSVPVPLTMKFYIYNWTDAEMFEDDPTYQKNIPQFELLGPYIFKEIRSKENITFHNPINDTVTYVDQRRYYFDSEKSKGSENDTIFLPYIPLFAAFSILAPNDPLWSELQLISRSLKIYMNTTPLEILYTGYHDFLTGLAPTVMPKIAPLMPGGKFAVFIQKNETDDGICEVERGNNDASQTNEFVTWNYEDKLTQWWGDTPCAAINGTDGMMTGTYTKKDKVIYIFDGFLCRTAYLTYERDDAIKGIDTYKFSIPESFINYDAKNSDNWCFCRNYTKDNSPQSCPAKGLIDSGPCKGGIELYGSLAECYLCDQSVIAQSGTIMKPQKDKHETYAQIEPITGMALEAHKRIQINIKIQKPPNPNYPKYQNLPDRILPLFWFDEGAELTDDLANFVKTNLLLPIHISSIIPYILYGIGALFIIVAVLVFFCCRADRSIF